MLLHAEMRKQQKNFPLQIFASDIDENALEKARLGRYSAEAVDAVPEQYRRDAFGPVDGHFLVAKHLRDSIVFSCQNLVSDPPFSRLDLVSCRNVLIYLQSEAQRKVISLFAFALVPGAHLFLGKSDSISGRDDLFQLVDKDARIFRRRASAKPNITDFPLAPSAETRAAPRGAMAAGAIKPLSLAHINQEVLLEHYKAAVVIVDARGKILHFFGDATRFLQLPTGEADLDILAMARDRLGLKLRPALHRVTDGEAMAHIHDVPLRRNGDTFRANVTLRPLHPEGWHEPLVAIIFEEVDSSGDEAPVNTELGRDEVVRELERELAATKNELQATYEQFETSNEELKAANEEVMSMNEELQSANEELETSKEELQSINEELTTVNNQLSEKVDELGTTNNDLANLLNATPVAVVFLDQNMRIKRFTPKATDLFNLIPEDAGRPIEHISQKFAGVNIVDDARGVMAHLNTVEREVHTQDAWYLVRLLPYRTIDNRIEGVVAVFQDVTMHKVRQRLAITALDIMRRPAIVVDRNRSVVQVNESAREMLGYGHREIEGAAFHRLRGEDWNRPALRRLLDQAFDGVAGESPETLRIASPDQGEVAYRVRVTPSTGDAQSVWFVIVTLAPQDE
ncbi:MAG: Chemotaxis protein methyltransferase Cher2 [Synergistetes bacterium ADurb.BinA166]|nr:MAG: Chemotaxis protein methyltransferase Cher2 [Synergistetes bacterium ADurb.BinA166]